MGRCLVQGSILRNEIGGDTVTPRFEIGQAHWPGAR
jgi:hypothetical protein